jgi:hypothetical protein
VCEGSPEQDAVPSFWACPEGQRWRLRRVAGRETLNFFNECAGATSLDVEFLDTGSQNGNSGLVRRLP